MKNQPTTRLVKSSTSDRLYVRDDVAEKVLNSIGVSFSSGADATHFGLTDFCYFSETSYKHRGSRSIYKAKLALRRVNFVTDNDGYNFVVAAVGGSYGMNGLQQGVNTTFSNFVRKQLHEVAETVLSIWA